jgi:hypothetical protein
MKKLLSGKGIALLASIAVAAAVAIGAFAYFTSSGSGSGTANAGSNDTAITLTATFDDGLVPGTSKTVSFSASNASSTTTGYVATISFDSVTSTDSGCQAYLTGNQADFQMSDVSEDTAVPKGGGDTALPNTGTLSWLNSDSVDQTPCAGQPLTLNVTSS